MARQRRGSPSSPVMEARLAEGKMGAQPRDRGSDGEAEFVLGANKCTLEAEVS